MAKRYFPDSIGTDSIPTVASTAALVLPKPATRVRKEKVICFVSGTAAITSISAAGEAGTEATLIFTDTAAAAGVTDGSNLKIAGSFAYSPDDTMTLVCDGTNWYETDRSAN